MHKKILAVCLLTGSCLTGFSQIPEQAKADSIFSILFQNNKFMGSVAIARDGKILYTHAAGWADMEDRVPLTPAYKFRLGSISKIFTAVLVFKAIEEKKLQTTTLLSEFYPAVKNSERISIEQMLYHRSGIHNFTDNPDYLQWNTIPKDEKDILNIIVSGGTDFEPGSRFQYSNSNYVLLSYILQKIYRKSFAEILAEKITRPLGLKDTYIGNKITVSNHECYSYTFTQSWVREKETDMSIPMGAGAVVSSAADMVAFGQALFSGKLVSPATLAQMTQIKDGVGAGLFPIPFYEHKGFGHGGAIDGFNTLFIYIPDSKISFALLSNGINYSINDIALKLLCSVYGKPFDVPQFTTYSTTATDLDTYLGIYSSKDLPLKLTISKNNNILIAQATGQQALQLEATGKHTFTYDRAGIVLVFNPGNKTVLLRQGGGEYLFERKDK